MANKFAKYRNVVNVEHNLVSVVTSPDLEGSEDILLGVVPKITVRDHESS